MCSRESVTRRRKRLSATDALCRSVPLFLPKQHPDGKWRVVSITPF